MQRSRILMIAILTGALAAAAFAQTPQLLKRTITKTDQFEFGAGGTVTITGAPMGSIRIVGTARNEIEITAQIEIQAPSEAGLARLASVTGFITDERISRTDILSFGTHNKQGTKDLWKKFPKDLLGLPFRIDYTIKVPRFCDLEIDGGKGDLSVSGVEGSMVINYLETNATVEVINGSIGATFGSGTAEVSIGTHGWRARAANIQVATGNLNIKLPSNLSAEIDAIILRTGTIENSITELRSRDRKVAFTDKSMIAKAGQGGVSLKFTVGDGTLKIDRLTAPL